MNGPDALGAGIVLDEFHGLASPTPAAMSLRQEELVDEGIASEKFQAIAERQHDVADRRLLIVDQPGAAKGRIAQKCQQSRASLWLIEDVSVKRVVLAHELQQE